MPPSHTLIEIQPDLDRWQRHHSQPSDEPSDPQSPRTRNDLLAHHVPTI